MGELCISVFLDLALSRSLLFKNRGCRRDSGKHGRYGTSLRENCDCPVWARGRGPLLPRTFVRG